MTGLEPFLLSAGASAGLASAAGTAGSFLSIGLTAASAFGSLSSGQQQASSLNLQARQADLNARTEKLEGKRKSLALQEQLDRDLASQNALFATRGILQGEGSALAAEEKARENATSDINLAVFGSDIAAGNAQQRGSNLRADATAAKSKGRFDALTTIGGLKFPKAPSSSLLEGL